MTKPTVEECIEWLDKEIEHPLQVLGSDNEIRTHFPMAMLCAIRAQLLAAQGMAEALGWTECLIDNVIHNRGCFSTEISDCHKNAVEALAAWREATSEGKETTK